VWIGTNNAIIRISAETEKTVDLLCGHTKLVHKMVSVGDEVWSCSSDSTICVWDSQVIIENSSHSLYSHSQIVKTGQCKRVLTGHMGRVFDLIVEQSHKNIVWSCSWDKTILTWDIASKQPLMECTPIHTDAVSCLAQVGK